MTILLGGTIVYLNIDTTKTYYCATKVVGEQYKLCESLSGTNGTKCNLMPNEQNKQYELCGIPWKKVNVIPGDVNLENCEFDLATNMGFINNQIYLLNNPEIYKTSQEILNAKNDLEVYSVCALAQQNETHKLIGLEEIRDNLTSDRLYKKVKYPELVVK